MQLSRSSVARFCGGLYRTELSASMVVVVVGVYVEL
jgi:hypothetical protein